MSTMLGSLRRLAFAPSLADVGFAGRGFSIIPTDATRRLEAVPQAVVCGFEWGIDTRNLWELERRLAMVEPDLRGFAYEGATMAFTILDAMGFRRGHRTRDLLRSSGEPHPLLAYIGIGFAMSKLPRALWKKIMPDLTGLKYFPIMTWLAVDGYGFDLAYFHPKRWMERQEIPAPYPWEGNPDYFLRAVDQGDRPRTVVHERRPAGAGRGRGRPVRPAPAGGPVERDRAGRNLRRRLLPG